MPFLSITASGTTGLQMKLQALSTSLRAQLLAACAAAGEDVVAQLAAAAPKGASGGGSDPVPGDQAGGPLAESFSSTTVDGGTILTVVKTSQPTKLGYVRRGTGLYGPSGQVITPRVKKALAWPGGEHPVRSVKGSPPNDFVSPVMPLARDRALARIQAALGAALQES